MPEIIMLHNMPKGMHPSLQATINHLSMARNIIGSNRTTGRIPLLDIRALIVSPGPGHPITDSGVSRDAIKYFAGKKPILGVCMGLECLVDVFGGEIS